MLLKKEDNCFWIIDKTAVLKQSLLSVEKVEYLTRLTGVQPHNHKTSLQPGPVLLDCLISLHVDRESVQTTTTSRARYRTVNGNWSVVQFNCSRGTLKQ